MAAAEDDTSASDARGIEALRSTTSVLRFCSLPCEEGNETMTCEEGDEAMTFNVLNKCGDVGATTGSIHPRELPSLESAG